MSKRPARSQLMGRLGSRNSAFQMGGGSPNIGAGNVVQLVANGGFGSDTIWTDNTWTIAAGVASAAGITAAMSQAIAITPGVNYLVTYTVTSFTGGTVTVILGGTSGTARGSAAAFAEIIKAGSVDSLIQFSASAATLSIDNVTVLRT